LQQIIFTPAITATTAPKKKKKKRIIDMINALGRNRTIYLLVFGLIVVIVTILPGNLVITTGGLLVAELIMC